MKKLSVYTVLICLLLLIIPVSADAEDGTMSLPSAMDIIEKEAFYGAEALEKVVISEGTTEIHSLAFVGCSLTEVVLPSTLTYIASDAFDVNTDMVVIAPENSYAYNRCVELGLIKGTDEETPEEYFVYEVIDDTYCQVTGYTGTDTDVVIPETLGGYTVKTIGESAFESCSSLTRVVIPDGVTEIGYAAFYGCSSMKNIGIPDSVTSISEGAFYGCSSLMSIEIPAGVKTIATGTFQYCSGLTSFTIPDGVTSIEYGAFGYCSNLTSVDIPESVTEIDTVAFAYCEKLQSITIPTGVTVINPGTFIGCTSLTEVNLPDGLLEIRYQAFDNCDSLVSIYLPDSITFLETLAFSECDSLSEVNYPRNWTIVAGDESRVKTPFDFCSKLENMTIPEGVTKIPDCAFSGSCFVRNYTFPGTLKTIGAYSFFNSFIDSLTLPEGVTDIQHHAFYNCTALRSVSLPSTLETIGDCAFSKCSRLESITIPESVTTIGDGAFAACHDALTIYGVAGSCAETYANKNNIPFAEAESGSPGGPVTAALSGLVTTTLGMPIENVLAVVTDEAKTTLDATSTDGSGHWSISGLPLGEYQVTYYLDGYAFTPAVTTAETGSTLLATGEVVGEADGTVTFIMTSNGAAVTSVATGETVNFVVSAPGAQSVRILVDGVPYNQYDLTEGSVVVNRSFTKAGERSVQFQTFVEDKWASVSDAQLLQVTALGDLAQTVIGDIGTQYVGRDMLLTWSAVENADRYTVYFYMGDTLLWSSFVEGTTEANTVPTSLTIPGTWLMLPGEYAVNVVASGANYSQSTAIANFMVETTDQVCITYPTEGMAYVVGSTVTIEYAIPSGIQGVKIAVEGTGETRLLAPDENGRCTLTLSGVGSYMLTPYYSDTTDDFTIDTATGSGVGVTISAGLPQIHRFRQGSYTSYAYYMDTAAIAPVFTGNVDGGVEVVCEISCTASDANHAAPTCTGEFTSESDGQTFTYQASALTQEGRYQFTFTPMAGSSAGTPVSFPVYVMTDVADEVRYNSLETELMTRPDDSDGRLLPAGTEMTMKATWGSMAYVTVDGRDGFVDANQLNETLTPAEMKIVEVVEPEHNYITIGDTRTFDFTVQGEVAGIEVQLNATWLNKRLATYPAVQDAENPNHYSITLPVDAAGMYNCTAKLITNGGEQIGDDWQYYFVCYDDRVNLAGERMYAKYLDIGWTDVEGHEKYLGWEDPADYVFTCLGSVEALVEGEQNYAAYHIAAKDGSEEYWMCLRMAYHDSDMTHTSTESVRKKALLIAFYMDQSIFADYEDGFEDDFIGILHANQFKRMFANLGIEQHQLYGPHNSASIRNFLEAHISEMDYNDELYICISGHGSEENPYVFGYCQDGTKVYASNFAIRDYTDHYIKCRYIVDACFSGKFSTYTHFRFKDSFGVERETIATLLASCPPDDIGTWTIFCDRLVNYVCSTAKTRYYVQSLWAIVRIEDELLDIFCQPTYYFGDDEGADIFFER